MCLLQAGSNAPAFAKKGEQRILEQNPLERNGQDNIGSQSGRWRPGDAGEPARFRFRFAP